MIKGVSKQILEVTNTENPYFEKIIFFVKPEYQKSDKSKLQKEAEALAAVHQKPPKVKLSKSKIISRLGSALLFTLSGCAISFLISLIF